MSLDESSLSAKGLKQIEVSTGFLERWLTGRQGCVSETTCPDDLEILGIEQNYQDRISGKVRMLVASKAFSKLPEGSVAPFVEPFVYKDRGCQR